MFFDIDVDLAADLSDQEIQRYSSRLADAVAELLEGRGHRPCRRRNKNLFSHSFQTRISPYPRRREMEGAMEQQEKKAEMLTEEGGLCTKMEYAPSLFDPKLSQKIRRMVRGIGMTSQCHLEQTEMDGLDQIWKSH